MNYDMIKHLGGIVLVWAAGGCTGNADESRANGSTGPGTGEVATDTEPDNLDGLVAGEMLAGCDGDDMICFRLAKDASGTRYDGPVQIGNARIGITWTRWTSEGLSTNEGLVAVYDMPFVLNGDTFGIKRSDIGKPTQAENRYCNKTCSDCKCNPGPSFAFASIWVNLDTNGNGRFDDLPDSRVLGMGLMQFVYSDNDHTPAPTGWEDTFNNGLLAGVHAYESLGDSIGVPFGASFGLPAGKHTFDFALCGLLYGESCETAGINPEQPK